MKLTSCCPIENSDAINGFLMFVLSRNKYTDSAANKKMILTQYMIKENSFENKNYFIFGSILPRHFERYLLLRMSFRLWDTEIRRT